MCRALKATLLKWPYLLFLRHTTCNEHTPPMPTESCEPRMKPGGQWRKSSSVSVQTALWIRRTKNHHPISWLKMFLKKHLTVEKVSIISKYCISKIQPFTTTSKERHVITSKYHWFKYDWCFQHFYLNLKWILIQWIQIYI